MKAPFPDALVFFGATGELAKPMFGMAGADETRAKLRGRARERRVRHGGAGADAVVRLSADLQYVGRALPVRC